MSFSSSQASICCYYLSILIQVRHLYIVIIYDLWFEFDICILMLFMSFCLRLTIIIFTIIDPGFGILWGLVRFMGMASKEYTVCISDILTHFMFITIICSSCFSFTFICTYSDYGGSVGIISPCVDFLVLYGSS